MQEDGACQLIIKAIPKQISVYKELLEVLRMPVANPTNPSEMDYIDLSLLEKLKIEPQFIYNFNKNRKEKIELLIMQHPSREGLLLYQAKFPNGYIHQVDFSVQHFEEILSEIVHGKDVKKLEYHPFFLEKTQLLIDNFIESAKEEDLLFARLDTKTAILNGLGIIFDKKSGQDVGTFEHFGFLVPNNVEQRECLIYDIFFSTRTNEEVASDSERYLYKFYDLKEGFIYFIEPRKPANILQSDIGSCHFKMTGMNFSMNKFTREDPYVPMIEKAQSTKHIMTDPDRDDPFFHEEFEKFKKARMDIIRTSKDQHKKEKIFSEFADIEL